MALLDVVPACRTYRNTPTPLGSSPAHDKQCYVKYVKNARRRADPGLPPPARHDESRRRPPCRGRRPASGQVSGAARSAETRARIGPVRLPPTYPQDAQTAVEMLIIQRSQIAAFSSRGTLARCPERPYIPSCAEHGAGVGRSSTGRLYGTARKGRNGKPVGVVDETATGSANFFGPSASAALARLRSPRCRFPLVLRARRASTRA